MINRPALFCRDSEKLFLVDRGCFVYPSCYTPSMDLEHGAHASGRGIMCGYDLAYTVVSVLFSVLFVVMMSSDFGVHGKASSVSIVCV